MNISFTIESVDQQKSSIRKGILTTAHGQIHTPAVIPLTYNGLVSPLTNHELIKTGCPALAVNILPLTVHPGTAVLQSLGGVHQFLDWQFPLISLVNQFPVMKKVKKNAGQLGVRYVEPYTNAHQRLTGNKAAQLQKIGQADLQIPLFQSADYYAPVNDLETALRLNEQWQSQCQSKLGVVTGGGLRNLRAESVQSLCQRIGILIGELPHDNLAEWQRIVAETIQMLPDNQFRMVIAQNDYEIHAALQSGVDLILTTEPIERAHRSEIYRDDGVIKLTHAHYENDPRRLQINGDLSVTYSYLHYVAHLQSEVTDHLLGIYNWTWLNQYVSQFRQSIGSGRIHHEDERFSGN